MATANLLQTSVSGGTQNALSLQGDGVFFPKASTTSRLALTLTTTDKGFIVYDTTDNNIYFWNGAAWESVPSSGDAGANGSVQYNDNGIVSGATNFVYDKATGNVGVGYAPSGSTDKLGSTATLGVVATGLTADLNFRNSSLSAIQRIRMTDGTGTLTIGAASTVAYPVELGGNTTTRAVTIDASQNVGIGRTPSAWSSIYKGLVVGGTSGNTVVLAGNDASLGTGYYLSGAGIYNRDNGSATVSSINMYNRAFVFRTAASGAVDSAIAWTDSLTLDGSGNLLVGTTSGSFRGQFAVASGADRNIFTAQVTGASNGLQVLWNHATTTLRIVLSNIPTSAAGLAAGTLWNDAGTIKIA